MNTLTAERMSKFFISHSGADRGRSAEIRQAISNMLMSKGYEVFDDSAIKPGEFWRARLYHELATCDAAVVILDHEALRPDKWWVRREAFYLLWRQFLGSVHVRGLVLDKASTTDLRDLGLGDLTETQLVRQYDPATPTDQIAEEIVDGFGQVEPTGDDAMRQWFDEIVDILKKVDSESPALGRFAAEFDVDDAKALLLAPFGYRFLAHQLMGRHAPERTVRAIDKIGYIIGTDNVRELAWRAAPAFVDAEAARPLARRIAQNPESRNDATTMSGVDRRPVYVLNADNFRTSDLYVRRANCCSRFHRCMGVSVRETGEDWEQDFREQCEKALEMILEMAYLSPKQRTLAFQDYKQNGHPLYVGFMTVQVTAAQLTDVEPMLEELCAQYPGLSVIVLTGETTPSLDTMSTIEFRLLEPLLNNGEELQISQALSALEAMSKR
jgi:hypothetical protein